MQKKKTALVIATIALGAMFPISVFVLSLITEAFIIMGLYCGLGALFCGLALIELKSGKQPNLIFIGLCMAFFGLAFLCISDFYRPVSIPMSILFILAGLFFFVKGIKNRRAEKQNRPPKTKKKMNIQIYLGIGLIVLGPLTSVLLFYINGILMIIGHIMTVAGLIFLGCGINQRKTEGTGSSTPARKVRDKTVDKAQLEPEYCNKCGRNITQLDATQVFVIDGKKYCADCKAVIDKNIENQHTICSVCGADLPFVNMHVIDDALICHTCFLKKYGNVDLYFEDDASDL